jgi:hypothetical protein
MSRTVVGTEPHFLPSVLIDLQYLFRIDYEFGAEWQYAVVERVISYRLQAVLRHTGVAQPLRDPQFLGELFSIQIWDFMEG